MKPVLIQHLIKQNKGKYQATPVSKPDQESHDRAASFILWFLGAVIFLSIIIS